MPLGLEQTVEVQGPQAQAPREPLHLGSCRWEQGPPGAELSQLHHLVADAAPSGHL